MIEMTTASKSSFDYLVAEGISMVRLGRSIEAVTLHMERDPFIGFAPFSVAEVMGEVVFWAGKPKG